jgi:hypothetical protein
MEHYLKDYIAKFGLGELKNRKHLLSYLKKCGADDGDTMRLIMIISSSGVVDIIERSKSRISSVALSTVLNDCVQSTGLSRETVRSVLESLFNACSKEYSFESFTFYDRKKKKQISTESAYISQEIRLKEHKRAEAYCKAKDLSSAYGVYLKLAKSGDAKAMYRLGIICKSKSSAFHNTDDAVGWLEAAIENGYSKAGKVLGDYYYENNGFINLKMKKAYLSYTAPGSLPADKESKRLADMIATKKANAQLLAVNGIILVLIVGFIFLIHTSVHNGTNMLNFGVVIGLLITAIYGTGIVVFIIDKFINQRVSTFLMTFVWTLYPLLLILN